MIIFGITSNTILPIRHIISCLLFVLIVHQTLYSQSPGFVHYQVENGLSNNTVICTMQDKQGFMWFGTKDGLNRFDGYTFRVFRHDPEDTSSLGNNFIWSLYEDDHGMLYVGTDKGLYLYNPASEQFRPIGPKADLEIRAIDKDAAGNIWFISGIQLYRYNPQTNSLHSPAGYPNASAICRTPAGKIWLSSPEGKIAVYDRAKDSFTSYSLFDHSNKPAAYWTTKILATSEDTLLVGTTDQGVKLFSAKTYTYTDILPYNSDKTEIYARDLLQRSADEYWIASETGIFIYHLSTGKFTNLQKKYNDPYAISDNAVYSLFKDKEGGIWAGTYFGGINYFPQQYAPFEKFFPKTGENALGGNAVREICPDKYGQLWIGTEDGGLNKLSLSTGNITNIKPQGKQNSLSHTNIHGLLVTGDTLWIGTFEHGLDLMHIPSGKFLRHYAAGNGKYDMRSNFVYSIIQTHTGQVLLCTSRGLYRYNRQQDGFDLVQEVPSYIFYTTVFEDSRGTIWLGTIRDGLYYYHPETGKKGLYLHDENNIRSLGNNHVNRVFEDSRHRIWAGTEDGLCLLNEQQRDFTRYTTRNGLLSNMIFGMLEDDKQHLWITTSKGLACLSPETGKTKVYTKASGLLNDQFNYNSAYKDSSGNMYFGSVRGMIRFNPDKFLPDNFMPPIYITGFQVFNNPLHVGGTLKKAINVTDTIVLTHDQSSFSIDFAALSYTAPEMTEYAYKMEGLDKDWTHLETNRKAFFTKLSPGTYHFMVKAANSSGNWSIHPRLLTIRILPPFWASYPAYALYLILCGGIIYLLISSYHRRAEQKHKRSMELLEHEKEKEIYEAKIEFFTNVAHEIRTPLTLIKGPMEKVIRKSEAVPDIQKNLRIMERNTNRLLDLTNQLLDFRKTEINGYRLNFVKTNIPDLLKENHLRFIPAAEQKEIRFKIELSSLHFFAYVDMEALHKILSNLINNAIKYADSCVYIQLLPVAETDTTFTIQVKNDGHIIPPEIAEKIFEPFYRGKAAESQPGTGIGLAIARSLTILHKGKLVLIRSDNNLNTFVLTLPVHQEIEFNLSKWKKIQPS
ncbi:two-component regulator propeller domain-containing protein [Chitinophaga sp. MM2321]|uniref:ligand-binding sensor domain-containing protein n=1 Tax=Chitinophaga sp. MM2321 TaxID=3137178 RepID=UPI0032D5A94B